MLKEDKLEQRGSNPQPADSMAFAETRHLSGVSESKTKEKQGGQSVLLH